VTDFLIGTDGDLVIEDFTIQLTPDLTESIKQRILIRLKTFKGEYFLDTNFGTPYYQQVFVKGISKGVVDSIFKSVINETPGVVNVISYSSVLNPISRTYTADFGALLDTGEVIEGTI